MKNQASSGKSFRFQVSGFRFQVSGFRFQSTRDSELETRNRVHAVDRWRLLPVQKVQYSNTPLLQESELL